MKEMVSKSEWNNNEKWINGCNHVKKTEDEIVEEATGNTPNIRTDGRDEESQCEYMLWRQ